MKWICALFLFLGQDLQANIYIRSQELDPLQFKEVVHNKQGEALSTWLATKDFSQTRSESLLTIGEKFLRAELNFPEFLTAANALTDHEIPNSEWRQAFIDILLKKNESIQKNIMGIWDQICYFYHLDEAIQERWPQFYQRCNQGKSKMSVSKPAFLKNDVVYVDGVEWKDKINFSQGSPSWTWSIQIRIYSDADVPLQLKAKDLNLVSISRSPLVHGGCGKFQFSSEALSKYELPLLQVFVISSPTCVEPVMTVPSMEGVSIWKKKSHWFWLAGLIAGGLLINEMKDKEIVFESP